jgi:hypothetical protein
LYYLAENKPSNLSTNCVETDTVLINAILQIGKRAQKTQLTGISPLRR